MDRSWEKLKAGDGVYLALPSFGVSQEEWNNAVIFFENDCGLKVINKNHSPHENNALKSLDERVENLWQGLKSDASAIVSLNGGQGMAEVVRVLKERYAEELQSIANSEKAGRPFLGYSDNTNAMLGLDGVISPISGFSAFFIQEDFTENRQHVRDFLMEDVSTLPAVEMEAVNSSAKNANISGKIRGGTTLVLCHQASTSDRLHIRQDDILFIEGFEHRDIEYTLKSLKESGELDKAKAIVVGKYVKMENPDVLQSEKLAEIAERLEISTPIFAGYPSGHPAKTNYDNVRLLPIGGEVSISSDSDGKASLQVAQQRRKEDLQYAASRMRSTPEYVRSSAQQSEESPLVFVIDKEKVLWTADTDDVLRSNLKGKDVTLVFTDDALKIDAFSANWAIEELNASGKLAEAKTITIALNLSDEKAKERVVERLQDYARDNGLNIAINKEPSLEVASGSVDASSLRVQNKSKGKS